MHGTPLRKILRQHPPLTAAFQEVQHRAENTSYKSTVRGLVRLYTLSNTGGICSNASLLISE
jgi:hypothetical protein